jgi:REP element-mobilizing transposase RayT
MSSTHLSLHVHVVFGTQHQRPLIQEPWRDRLHAFLGGAIRTAGATPQAIVGVADHVHLLIGLNATHSLTAIMRDIKAASSRWGMKPPAIASSNGRMVTVPSRSPPPNSRP